jgi:hypothetical protein
MIMAAIATPTMATTIRRVRSGAAGVGLASVVVISGTRR